VGSREVRQLGVPPGAREPFTPGFVGASASHVIDEYLFESLADFEAALAGMAGPQFRAHSDGLAPFIVPGSQQWVVYRVLE
jgi:hypothetical protein